MGGASGAGACECVLVEDGEKEAKQGGVPLTLAEAEELHFRFPRGVLCENRLSALRAVRAVCVWPMAARRPGGPALT